MEAAGRKQGETLPNGLRRTWLWALVGRQEQIGFAMEGEEACFPPAAQNFLLPMGFSGILFAFPDAAATRRFPRERPLMGASYGFLPLGAAMTKRRRREVMNLHQPHAEVYVPDGLHEAQALARTTHLCIAAHHDDIEIMAAHAVLTCFQQSDKWFTGVVVTDGRGSPRAGRYADYTDDEMWAVRRQEQRKAAFVGEYAAQIMLDYPSKVVKDGRAGAPVEDMAAVLEATRPQVVYTHNLADKHDTHVAVALRLIQAIRQMPPEARPQRLYGCEVWRDLDWMSDDDKIVFDLSAQENLQAALLGVFDSQISGGKRYDLAALGRRRVNATFFASHAVDETTGAAFAMDLSPLIRDEGIDPLAYVQGFIERFRAEVAERVVRLRSVHPVKGGNDGSA